MVLNSATLTPPETRASLLGGMRMGEPAAWSKFYERYGPFLLGLVKVRRVPDADAKDLVHDVFIDVDAAFKKPDGGYRPERGRFRDWLKTIVRNHVIDLWKQWERERKRNEVVAEQMRLEVGPVEPAEDAGFDALFNRHFERNNLRLAVRNVKARVEPERWVIFEWLVLHGRKPAEVANTLDCTVGRVYVAKHHVAKMLREELERLDRGEI